MFSWTVPAASVGRSAGYPVLQRFGVPAGVPDIDEVPIVGLGGKPRIHALVQGGSHEDAGADQPGGDVQAGHLHPPRPPRHPGARGGDAAPQRRVQPLRLPGLRLRDGLRVFHVAHGRCFGRRTEAFQFLPECLDLLVLGDDLVPQVIKDLIHLVHPVAAESDGEAQTVDVRRGRALGQQDRRQGGDRLVEAVVKGTARTAVPASAEDFRRQAGAQEDGDADQHNRQENQEETH